MQLIGTPDEADLGFVNENAKRYIGQLPRHPRQSFPEKFPHVHPAAIDLVEKMLTFDPRRRITGELTSSCACVRALTHYPPSSVLSFENYVDNILTDVNLCIYIQFYLQNTHMHMQTHVLLQMK